MSHDESRGPQHESQQLFADVIVPRHIAKPFTYLVPGHLTPVVAIGQRVVVPFGRATLEGAVVALRSRLSAGIQPPHLKEILSLADPARDFPRALFELSRRIADEYLAPWGQCLRLVLPPGRPSAEPSPRYRATEQGRTAMHTEACPNRLRPLLARIARRSGGVLASTLTSKRDANVGQDLSILEKNGWIARVMQPQAAPVPLASTPTREGRSSTPVRTNPPVVLPLADTGWITRLDTALRGLAADRILVHASWPHRISLLIHALQQTHVLEKSALIIVGEVARADWLGRLITDSTGFPVILIHSDLDEAIRLTRWEQIQDVPAIVVGTRSAVFAPLRSLGLVWIEGEENPALKEPQEPRFHARDVAWMRAQAEHVPLVLGSSHPSLESYWADGMHVLSGPASDANAPLVEVVDLRREPRGSLFSGQLLAAIRDTFERKDRVLLFLNRKGFAGALVCRDCGWVPRCATCAVAFALFRHVEKLACRYCGKSLALPDLCPTCSSTRLHPVGEGTERVEVETKRLFPNARILRIDGSTLRGAAAARDLWRTAFSGDWDMLIGTQVLFQREPLPSVGLCGILQAESGMNIPDFRAAERTYQLLGNAISLVRPAASGGRVILQALWPSHHVVEALNTGNPSRFYHEELAARRLLGYPPALHLIALSISGTNPSSVERAARQVVEHLEQSSSNDMAAAAIPISGHSMHASSTPVAAVREDIAILGPVPAADSRRRGQPRYQILVKGPNRASLLEAVRRSVKAVEETSRDRHLKVSVDVDPVEMV